MGRSALYLAIDQGKWHLLQLLLGALCTPQFSAVPGAMRPVIDTFSYLAAMYPLDFLSFVGQFELQLEPEVLSEADASADVMLGSRVARGSSSRAPKGLWSDIIAELRHQRDLAAASGPEAGHPHSSHSSHAHSSHAHPQGTHYAGTRDGAEPIELGFNASRFTGLQAFRVPLEGFGALPPPNGESVLHLIVRAVSSHHDYSVFGSTLVELLLDFKWQSFARRKYTFDVSAHSLQVLVVLAWNLLSSQYVQDSLSHILHGAFVRFEANFVLLAVLWLFTSISSVLKLRVEFVELASEGAYRCTCTTTSARTLPHMRARTRMHSSKYRI